MSEPEKRPRRTRVTVLVAVALALTAAVVAVALVVLDDDGDPAPAASSSPSPTPLDRVDLSDLPIARQSFCDALDEDHVEDALGTAVSATGHYDSGDRVRLTPTLRDLAHEYGCTFAASTGAQARAWVFAEPVTRQVAAGLVREERSAKGCRPVRSAPTYGTPTLSTLCRTKAGQVVTLRGLFGDAWLTCELTVPGTPDAPETVRRAEQWCVRVATTLGARP
jgi:hypothetical protein